MSVCCFHDCLLQLLAEDSWADCGRNRWRTPSPNNFPCFSSTWCGCVAYSWQQRLGDLSASRPGTTSCCCGCSWLEDPSVLPRWSDGRSGVALGKGSSDPQRGGEAYAAPLCRRGEEKTWMSLRTLLSFLTLAVLDHPARTVGFKAHGREGETCV